MANIKRIGDKLEVTIANGEALSDAFNFKEKAGGCIRLNGWTAANIGFKVDHDGGGNFARLRKYDSDDTLEITDIPTAEDVVIILPPELFGVAGFVKLWSKSTSADTDENQGADRVIEIMLKT